MMHSLAPIERSNRSDTESITAPTQARRQSGGHTHTTGPHHKPSDEQSQRFIGK